MSKRRAGWIVWFHRTRAIAWIAITLAALRWWSDAVWLVIIMSGYANAVSDWTAAAASDDSEVMGKLDRIEGYLRRP